VCDHSGNSGDLDGHFSGIRESLECGAEQENKASGDLIVCPRKQYQQQPCRLSIEDGRVAMLASVLL